MWQADLEDAESFLAPIKGCKYVIHTASPVVMNPPKGKVSSQPDTILLSCPSTPKAASFLEPAGSSCCKVHVEKLIATRSSSL